MATSFTWDSLSPSLQPELVAILIEEFKFLHMMPVQKEVIPLFISNKDVVVEVCICSPGPNRQWKNTGLPAPHFELPRRENP